MEGPITNPTEELSYLKRIIEEKEQELQKNEESVDRAEIISERIIHHHKTTETDEAYTLSPEETNTIALNLSPDNNDATMRELQLIMEEKGIKNALAVAKKMKSPHIFDDFHRFLVQYVNEDIEPKQLRENSREWKSLHSVLYQVSLPETQEDTETPFAQKVSAMTQFYSGMLSIADNVHKNSSQHFTIELAVPAGSKELSFYVSVPESKTNLFEKQLLSIFPDAIATLQSNDYNPFVENGAHVGTYARLEKNPAFSLKTFTDFDYDPINSILNAFAKIEKDGGGAAIQLLIQPSSENHIKHYKKIQRSFEKGSSRQEALSTPKTILGNITKGLADELVQKSTTTNENKVVDTASVESIQQKVESRIVDATIRIVVSSENKESSMSMLSDLKASFNQFESTNGNKLIFEDLKKNREEELFRVFSFRLQEKNQTIPLSINEVTTIIHFPPEGITSTPQFKQSKFTGLPAPLDLPQEGTKIGTNTYRGISTNVFLTEEDRLRHTYVLGQTGTGKTTLLKNMILQDIQAGNGVCFIDPHGSDVLDVLSNIPKERYEDVIYVDPAYMERSIGINLLEFDSAQPEQKTFIVNELLAIFRRLYGSTPESLGPAFEQYFRNATMLVMDSPESGNTMLDIRRIFTDKEFREQKIASATNELVKSFWTDIASQASGEQGLENYGPYITNKFDDFVTNDFIRPIIAQEKSSFDFREIMDTKKILLVNLSKGRLGERNANFLGLLFVGKLFMSALSRAGSPRSQELPPFFLYIDEFQNITTDTIPSILSEARKYKLSLNIAHQFLKQVDESILNAVFGNVGSMVIYRTGPEDAETFEQQFAPHLSATDFMNIENFNGYAKILANGVPQKPFNIRADSPPQGNEDLIDMLKQLSFLKYGQDRKEIEESIKVKYLDK